MCVPWTCRAWLLSAISLTLLLWPSPPAALGEEVVFQKHQLDAAFRSEGVAVGDFNHDGKLDIAANNLWYEGRTGRCTSFMARRWPTNRGATRPPSARLPTT